MDNQISPVITFSDSAEDEARQVIAQLRLSWLLERVGKGEQLTDEDIADMQNLILMVADLLDTNLPDIYIANPLLTLQLASRDINLSRILRERGLFRLFRLTNTNTADGIPIYMTIISPYTGNSFSTQEEFLGWFCMDAHVSRSLVFQRMGIIKRLLNLGMGLDRAYQIVVSKPSVVRDILKLVAGWGDNEIIDLDPNTVLRITEHVSPDKVDDITPLIDAARDDPQKIQELSDAFKPIIVSLLDEVASHPSATDASDLVRHDILARPEIRYRIDPASQAILVDVLHKKNDPMGVEYISEIVTIPFVPDTPDIVPAVVMEDLLRRLPIRNRQYLDN